MVRKAVVKVMNRIYEKLNDIQELDDKVILKKIMMSVFSSLEEYSNEKYAQLEERVFDEVEYVEEKYNIYSTIIRRNELDMTDEIFFPMIEKDKEEKTYDIKDLLGTLRNNKTYELFSIFLTFHIGTISYFIYLLYSSKSISIFMILSSFSNSPS